MRDAIFIGLCTWLLGFPAMGQQAFATFDKASEPILNDPHDLAFGPDGNLYVADKFGDRIVVMDPDTLEILSTFGDGTLLGVHDISFGPDGKAYVAVTGMNALAVFDLTGDEPVIENMLGGFARTEGALAHSNGRVYVMASGTGQLVAFADGEFVAGARGMFGAHDVAEAPDGTVWVADNASARVVQFTPDLEFLKILSGPDFGMIGPRYLDFDDFGRLVVADQDAHRILLIDPEKELLLGTIGDGTPGLGPGLFDDPEGVTVRGSNYYFSDSDNNRIVKYVVVLN